MTIPEQIKNKLQLKESCEVEYKSAAGGFIRKIGDKLATNKEIGDKMAINEDVVDKLADIMVFLKQHPRSKSADIAELMGMGTSNVRNYLNCLVLLELVSTDGANKNRVYSITQM